MMLFGCSEQRRNKITDYFRTNKRWVSSKPPTGQEVASHEVQASGRGRLRPPPCVPSSQSRQEERVSAPASNATTTTVPAPRDGSVASSRRSRPSRARSNGRASSTISVINKIRKNRSEYEQTRDSSVERRTLDSHDYEHLLERIRNNPDPDLPRYFDRELKYEYLAFTDLFVIHMTPTPIHSGLASTLCSGIVTQLWNLNVDRGAEGEGKKLREKASRIWSLGDGRVKFKGRPDERSPDGSFRYNSCEYSQPGLTVEVNWSHYRTAEDFEQKARDLIELGNGVIRTVINVDLGQIYRAGIRVGVNTGGAAPATLSVWRANSESATDTTVTARRDIHSQVFRDTDGEVVESTALRLSVRDFVCDKCAECKAVRALEGSRDETIVISAENLCAWYDFSMETFLKSEAEAQPSQPQPEPTQVVQEPAPFVQAPTPPADAQPVAVETLPRRSERIRNKIRDRLRRSSNADAGPGHNSP